MRILVADRLSAHAIEVLEAAGHAVLEQPALGGEALVAALAEAQPQVLIVRSTRVPAEAMDAAPSLELIVRAGAGYDTIDLEAASGRGIFVANCPGKNADAVAELTMGLLLALDRRLPDNVAEARAGRWNKAAFSRADGLKGRTLGIVGLGHIGQAVARRAQAFGMSVLAWSRSLTEAAAAERGVRRASDPLEVAARADAVTLHVAATPETKHLANRAFFEAMREGALFVNTTRASVVDEAALAWAVEHRGLRVALDVMEGEPAAKEGPFAHPLAGHPNVYFTHHIGASTRQAQEAIAAEAARVVTTYADTGHVPNAVNMATQTPATHLLTVRHLDRVGVLAAVLDEMRLAGWNVQEMENLVFDGAKAACARIRFDGTPGEAVVQRIQAHPDVLAVTLLAL